MRGIDHVYLSSFMKMGGEFFDVIRNEEVVGKIEGLPNHEKESRKKYVGFYEGSDIQVGDWISGHKSKNLFYIDDLTTDIVHGQVLQVKGYYLTKSEYDKREEEKNRSNQPASTVIYNLNGANARVNNNSNDHSTNVVNTSPSDLFDEIKKVLKDNLKDESEVRDLRILVNEMENTQETPKFNEVYTRFITSAANHMTLLAPFLPALSQMIRV